MKRGRDRDLERLFAEARAAEEHAAPSFARALAPRAAATVPHAARLRVTALAAAALILAGLVSWWRAAAPNEPRLVIAFAPGEMRVPTDYLLDMATFTRAGEIPRIRAEWLPLPLPNADINTRRTP